MSLLDFDFSVHGGKVKRKFTHSRVKIGDIYNEFTSPEDSHIDETNCTSVYTTLLYILKVNYNILTISQCHKG